MHGTSASPGGLRRLAASALVVSVVAAGLLAPAPAPASVPLSFTPVVVDGSLPGYLDNKAVGDLDGDGLPDIVVGTDDQLVWYRAPGWSRATLASGHNFTTDMQVGDVDGDGDLDVVTPQYDAGALVWYRNPAAGGGAWAPVAIGTPGGVHDVEVGDVDGDGRLDVVTRGHGGPTTLFRQAAPGSWQAVGIPAAPPGEGTALGDVDRDGRLDIVQNGYWLAAPPDVTAGGAWTRHDFAAQWGGSFVGVALGDLNGDGRLDVALAASESEGRMAWYEAPADPRAGGWAEHLVDGDADYVHTFKAADMDADGDADLVFAEMLQSSRRRVGIHRNDGGGRAWTYVGLSDGGSHNVRVADIGADGDLDVVGANWQGGAVQLWENRGAAPPAPSTSAPTAAPTTGVPTTSPPTTGVPPTGPPTTSVPTTSVPSTSVPTTTTTAPPAAPPPPGTPPTAPPPAGGATRVDAGLVALYPFAEGTGTTVRDTSAAGPPLDLAVVDPGAVRWVPGGIEFVRPGGAVRSPGPATKVAAAARAAGGVTLEAWVTPADLAQGGPARIATVSSGTQGDQVDVHLGQSGTAGSTRLRTTAHPYNWMQAPGAFSSTTGAVHVVATFDGTTERMYVDGAPRLGYQPGGTLANWDDSYPLVVGNEATLDRSWLGTVHLVAVYGRALSPAEVARNFAAGPGA